MDAFTHKKEVIVGDFVHQDVVDESAVLIQQAGILRLADFEFRSIVGGDVIDQVQGLRTANLDLAHVADIENPDALAHGVVLFEHAGILHGHVPSAEVDHLCAHAAVNCVQRSRPQRRCRLGHASFRLAPHAQSKLVLRLRLNVLNQ